MLTMVGVMIDDAIKQLRKVELVLLLACASVFAGFLFSHLTQASRALDQLDTIVRLFPDSPPVADNSGDVEGVWKPNWLYDYVSQRLVLDSTLEPLRYDDQWWHVQDSPVSRDREHALHLEGLLWTTDKRTARCRQDERTEFLFVARPGAFEARCVRPFEQPKTLRELDNAWRILAEPLIVYVAQGLSSNATRVTWYHPQHPRDATHHQVQLAAYPNADFSTDDPEWEHATSGDYPRRVFRGVLVHDTQLTLGGGSDTSSLFVVNLADHQPNKYTSLLVARPLSLRQLVFNRRIAFASVHRVDWPSHVSVGQLFPDLTAMAAALPELSFADLRNMIESEVMRTSQRSVEVLGQSLWGVDIARFGGLGILGIQWYLLVQLIQLAGMIKHKGPSVGVAWLALSSDRWARGTVIVTDVLIPLSATVLAAVVLWGEGGQSLIWARIFPVGLVGSVLVISVCVCDRLKYLARATTRKKERPAR